MALFDFGKKKDQFADMQIPGLPPLPPLPPEFQMPQQQANLRATPPAPQAISQMQAQGMSNPQIIQALQGQGYPSTDILAGMQQQQMQQPQMPQFMLPPIPAAPPPPTRQVMGPSKEDVVTLLTEDIQEIAETIIAEKWNQQKKEFTNLEKWQEDVEDKLNHINESVAALQQRMDGLEKSIFGKVEEYGKGMSDVSTELKAMQRVFSTVMPTFTANIKEMQGLLESARKKKK